MTSAFRPRHLAVIQQAFPVDFQLLPGVWAVSLLNGWTGADSLCSDQPFSVTMQCPLHATSKSGALAKIRTGTSAQYNTRSRRRHEAVIYLLRDFNPFSSAGVRIRGCN